MIYLELLGKRRAIQVIASMIFWELALNLTGMFPASSLPPCNACPMKTQGYMSSRQGYRIFCGAIFQKMMFDLPGNISFFKSRC
jgi:hypothetical protein